MRIALVSQEYPPETGHGGIATQTYAKAHGLADLGHEVYVISHSLDSVRHEYETSGVRVIRIPGFDGELPLYTESARWITYSALVASEISALDSRVELDLVDFAEWGSEGYVYLVNRTAWQRIPTVIQLHGPLVMFAEAIGWPAKDSDLYRIGSHMERTCLQLADTVFSSSHCSARWCADHYGLDLQTIEILHMGVDVSFWKPLEVPKENDPTIVFVGKIARNKGVELLLDAALELVRDHPDLKLWMFGPGDEELGATLQQKAAAHGHADLLEIFGYVEASLLAERLPRAHVFAAPSVYEGGPGFVYMEAMSCGLPVVASAGSGASEIVRSGETGILVEPGDLGALTSALKTLIEDSRLRSEMGVRARQSVIEEADSVESVKRLEKLYASVIASAPRSGPDSLLSGSR